MAFINRMRGQDYIDTTRKYLNYLEEHLNNVCKAFNEVSNACEGMEWVGDDSSWFAIRAEVKAHDLSKFSKHEFVQYRNHFFPVTEGDKESSGFTEAWENHKKENHHHHETVENLNDIIHMIIDWTAMGYKFGDTAQEYYEANKDKIALKDEHQEFMYKIFESLSTYANKP